MRKVKLVTGTATKPDIFEDRMNELLCELENDKRVKEYSYEVLFSDNSILGVVKINIEKGDK